MSKDCSEIELLHAGYAIGALDAEERKIIDRHIGSCESCSKALTDFEHVSEELLFKPPLVEPSPRVRANLIAALASSTIESSGESWDWRGIFSSYAIGGAIIALVILNLALLSQSLRLRKEVDQLADQQLSNQTALTLAYAPAARWVVLSGDTANGSLVFDPDMTVAVVYLSGLEPLPPNEAYQAWLISPDGSRTSGGLLQPESDSEFAVLVIQSPEPMNEFIGFGMTIEPSTGSPGPTGPRVIGAEL